MYQQIVMNSQKRIIVYGNRQDRTAIIDFVSLSLSRSW